MDFFEEDEVDVNFRIDDEDGEEFGGSKFKFFVEKDFESFDLELIIVNGIDLVNELLLLLIEKKIRMVVWWKKLFEDGDKEWVIVVELNLD